MSTGMTAVLWQGGTGREPEQAKAGYRRGDGILPFAILNKAWYTWLSSTTRKLMEETV